MSDYEVAYGWFRPSDEKIEPEDTDDFYALEEKKKKTRSTTSKSEASSMSLPNTPEKLIPLVSVS